MTKPEKTALEQLFVQDMEAGMRDPKSIARISKGVATKLMEKGMIEPGSFTLGHDRFGAIEVQGFVLTNLGMFTYCESCDGEEEEEGIEVIPLTP